MDKKVDDNKSKILFTAAHHSRELITVNMVIKIMITIMHNIIYTPMQNEVFHYSKVIIVPIVNYDGHLFITRAYGTKNWN